MEYTELRSELTVTLCLGLSSSHQPFHSLVKKCTFFITSKFTCPRMFFRHPTNGSAAVLVANGFGGVKKFKNVPGRYHFLDIIQLKLVWLILENLSWSTNLS